MAADYFPQSFPFLAHVLHNMEPLLLALTDQMRLDLLVYVRTEFRSLTGVPLFFSDYCLSWSIRSLCNCREPSLENVLRPSRTWHKKE